jgi:hypothetical protein
MVFALAECTAFCLSRSAWAMKVLDLCCARGHMFEGWFGSEEDFLSQQERQLVQCPVCGDAAVVRRPSAPRLNLSTTRGEAQPPSKTAEPAAAARPAPPAARAPQPEQDAAAMQAALVQVVREVLQNTEDVGERFTEEARRIHYGERQARGIRGQATPEQRAELREEGIEVFALPLPEALKGPTH